MYLGYKVCGKLTVGRPSQGAQVAKQKGGSSGKRLIGFAGAVVIATVIGAFALGQQTYRQARSPTRTPTSNPATQDTRAAPEPTDDTVWRTEPITYYAQAVVYMRACPSTTCARKNRVAAGEPIEAIGQVEGEAVSGSNKVWYQVEIDGDEGYVYSGVVSQSQPVPAAQSQSQPQQSSGGGATCGGASTCSQMSSCQQAYACLAEGNGRLDRDNDGVPCEDICG